MGSFAPEEENKYNAHISVTNINNPAGSLSGHGGALGPIKSLDDHEFGMPLTEDANMSAINTKLANPFGRKAEDGASENQVSMRSGIFGAEPGSVVTSPATSLIRENHFGKSNDSNDGHRPSKYSSAQNSIEKKHRRQSTFGGNGSFNPG